MIIDSSVLIALLRNEPEAARFAHLLANRSEPCRLSVANDLEPAMVIDSNGDAVASALLDEMITRAAITIEAVTLRQAQIARSAFRQFGKGGGHPARLNFGDCFAYALTKETGECLLFKGNDFIYTDFPPCA
ncbi:MAG: type II toxin-antitoxin system VapC family toxin [Magnetococcales bacterium]|nr:type II toxin-antitoxin system VapC family toxin [Magnetococcales bacterium]